MQIITVCFTKTGYQLADSLRAALKDHEIDLRTRETERLDDICREAFETKKALLFIGAAGIAVRHIAPYVKDKLSDPPVLVMDEKGLHVIPLLSGHVGGANEIAIQVANAIGADPVLTTATDIEQAFSVDLYAKENDLRIINREGIAKVSVKALEGKPVTISVKPYPPKEEVDVIVTDEETMFSKGTIALAPKEKPYVLGIGCKKGKEPEAIEAHVLDCLKQAGISMDEVFALATIDIKKEEAGLLALSKTYRLPLFAYEAAILEQVEGSFTPSGFVKETTGVDNVCERAAVCAAGKGSHLIMKKTAANGVTVAIAKREI